MKIVILDALTLGKDINKKQLELEGELFIYDTTTPGEVIERINDADIVITNKVVLGSREFDNANNLKLICVAATGYNNIDVPEAKKRNIVVANVKSYSTESVAQQVFTYLLAFYSSAFEYQAEIKMNKWQQSPVFTMLSHSITELSGKKLGIIGYGTIGKRVAEIAKAFGMNIFIAKIPNRKYEDKEERMELEELLQTCDVVSIHSPLTDLTKNLIGKNELNKMKSSAILINMARGGIVDEKDLFYALKNKTIRGAIVDVLTTEPPSEGNILFNAPNIFITPHIAWTSVEARQRLVDGIVRNIRLFKEGKSDLIQVK